MSKSIGALLLAAGFSKRFGDTKLFARLDTGNTVLAETYSRLSTVIPEIIVVSRPELSAEVAQQAKSAEIFSEADRGMGASLAFGINKVAEQGWDACMICLADMPFIQESTYRRLAESADKSSIVMPSYDGKVGNPVVFGSIYFPELIQVSGDAGGRSVVRRHQDQTIEVPVTDPAVLADIDTPEELKRYQQDLP